MPILHLLTILLFIYLLPAVLYLFVLAAAGRLGRLPKWSSSPVKTRIAVLIPSYKEDPVILHTAAEALKQDYPAFSVTVIADGLQPETIARLATMPLRVLPVQWEKSMKAKSLNAALSRLQEDNFDIALILDADNLMSPGCLEKINHAFQAGRKAVQCHRTAKNRNNAIAILDAISEEINNTIFRRGQRTLGLSCALIGSGMAFEFGLLREIFALPTIQENPGEDKEVEVQLIKRNISVEYLEDAYVYDEKVQRKEVFEKQRTRWLATQQENFRLLLAKEMRPVFLKKIYLNKVFEWLLPPRLLLVILFCLILSCCTIDAWTHFHILSPHWPWWFALTLLYAAALLIAIPPVFYNGATLRALLKIPALMLAMLKALLGVKKNKTGFIHTPKEFQG
ncbi:MAG TPA: glycosyltransferase [Puia sp.]|jgi:cellulose synthase/poly-beta-1,6-N-acetylglucosamine synthase-like glycosyltransferase|nr:glycosyltransferase [Puia sp.]